MDSYIICGGKGARVAELCKKYNCEKHELPVDGHKFVEFTVRGLLDSNIVRSIQYIKEQDIGTGGAIRFISSSNTINSPSSYPYVMIYGDMYVRGELAKMYGNFITSNADLMMVTMETADQDYGLLDIIDTNKVIGYKRKHEYVTDYLTNVGMYLIGERFHTFICNYPQLDPLSLEKDIFENDDILGMSKTIYEMFNIVSYRVNSNRVFDIGTPSRYEITTKELKW